jgi:SAM-dependent methyltransferase
MLAVVRDEAGRRGLGNVRLVEARAESLPFRAESVGGVACRVAAHHFDDPDAYVRESGRILAPGGWFLLVDTVAPEDDEADRGLNHFEAVRDPSHRRDWKVGEWRSRTSAAGLRVESVSSRRKRLGSQDWMDRMSVPGAQQLLLWEVLRSCTGPLRDYLAPDESSFDLHEMTLLARKP